MEPENKVTEEVTETEQSNPSMEEVENFFTDVPKLELPNVDDHGIIDYQMVSNDQPTSPEDPEEKIWHNIELALKALRQRKHDQVDKQFKDRLMKLVECC